MANGLVGTVDIEKLRRLYSSNECAKAILDHVAGRNKNSVKTNVDRLETVLREGKFSRREIVGALKKLEELQCGTFVIGRRGQPSRFEWAVEMIGLGRAAQGAQSDVEILDAAQAEPVEPEELTEEEAEIPSGIVRHVYMIRPDFAVVLNLPEDLTTKESLRLAEFIKTLPFDTEE